jgi:hypothetical protein
MIWQGVSVPDRRRKPPANPLWALILFAGIRFWAIPPWIVVIAGCVAGILAL